MRSIRSVLGKAVASIAALVFAGCGTVPIAGAPGPAVEAPTLRVGDRWVYHGIDGYRTKVVWDETYAVTAVGTDGIRVEVTDIGPTMNFTRNEVWAAPGVVRSGAIYEAESDRFDPPFIRYQYPLTTGATWSQAVRDLNKPPGPYGPIRVNATVGGYESVSTPAGTFDAIKIRYLIQLDDETFWRYPTQCDYVVWYAPAVGAAVREQRRSYYIEKSVESSPGVPGQNAIIELTSFTRGR